MKDLIKKFIPLFLLSWYHFLLAFLGAIFYCFPSHKLKIIGVTGTNGKTTVTEMIFKILEEAGYKVALMNSIRFKIQDKEEPNMLKMTMPGRFEIQRFLKQAVNSGCQYVVLEVTSEGIKQHRHRFIDFETAVFTNLTPEHIEAHGSFENYRAAKGKLFQATKGIHIINLDDKNSEYYLTFSAQKKFLYTLNPIKKENKNLQNYITLYSSIQKKDFPLKFLVEGVEFKIKLIGNFNVYNALAAICVGISQGISLETCKLALEKFGGVPGRMEEVISQPFKVFVDYTFTPNALQKVYETLSGNSKFQISNSKQIPNSKFQKPKLICVLGACGGGRDKWKRPVLGEIAEKYCDEIIVTNEDPYEEDPLEIIEQVAQGTKGKAQKILDRREAIRKSLKLARPNDIVIITGKGCEPWMCVAKGKKIPWDDRKVVKEEFEKINE